MTLTNQALRTLGFTAREVKLFQRTVSGGRAGGAGARYEDWYAAYRLLEAALAFVTSGRDAAVETQAQAFVNDVVIHDSVTDYCQTKTSSRVAWDAQLRHQFLLQRRLSKARHEAHRVLLVTPHAQRIRALRRRKPPKAHVEVFANVPPWDPASPAAAVLRELNADPKAGPSQSEALAKAYFSFLLGVAPGQRCDAGAATASVRGLPTTLVRSAATPPPQWPEAEAILQAIPGLTITIERGVCTYAHGPERGIVGACDSETFARILDRVIERKPTTFKAFYKEL